MFRNFLSRVLGIDLSSDAKVRAEINQELDDFETQMQAQQAQVQRHQPTPEQIEAMQRGDAQHPDGARVIFSVDGHGQVTIQMQWTNQNESTANAMGTLLHFINEGRLGEQCEKVLNGSAQSEPRARPFIQKVASAWKQANDEDQQVVKPSEVFQMGRQTITRPTHAGGGPGGPV